MAILLFTRTDSGGTDHVWFYDVDADGKSLDDNRTGLVPPAKFGSLFKSENDLQCLCVRTWPRPRSSRPGPGPPTG
jgi:hypothetical protein